MAYPKTPIMDRFNRKYEVDLNSGCWLWSDALDVYGYGRLQIDGKPLKAHRVAFQIFNGEIPDGKIICHKCDVRCCVNPEHLFVGTWQDNVSDMMKKGRYKVGGKPHPGGKNGRAILSDGDAAGLLLRKIRGEKVSPKAEAAAWGMSRSSIDRLINGKAWKHLPRAEAALLAIYASRREQ